MEKPARGLERIDIPIDLLEEKVDREMLQQLLLAVREVDYGSIEILIHNAKVVQIERRERFRANGNQTNGSHLGG